MEKKDTSFAAYNSEKPVEQWTIEEVVDYTQEVLDFDGDDTVALQKAKLNGRRLLRVPSLAELKSYGLPGGAAVDLWAEIEKLKKSLAEPAPLQETPIREITSKYAAMNINDTPAKAVQRYFDQIATKSQRKVRLLSEDDKVELLLAYVDRYQNPEHDVRKKLNWDQPEIKPAVTKPNAVTRPKSAAKKMIFMPLQERNQEFEKALNVLRKNIANIDSHTKQDHCFYTILAGTGAGKTRLCEEVSKYVKDKQLNTYSIKIDFSNGDSIDEIREEKSSASDILGLRIAARLLFGCSSADLLEFLSQHEVPIHTFSFTVVMKAYYQTRLNAGQKDLVNLIIVIDEINALLKTRPPAAKEILRVLGRYMCNSDVTTEEDAPIENPASAHKLALLPIISGTIIGHIEEEVLATYFAHEIASVPLLTEEANVAVFSQVYPDRISWLTNKVFKRTLDGLGRLPRCLERILKVCEMFLQHKCLTLELARELAEKAYINVLSLYSPEIMAQYITEEVLQQFLLVVLAGHKVAKEEISLEDQSRLEKQGIIYRANGTYILPYPLLRALLPRAGRNFIREHLLPLPGVPFYWQHFEDLEAQLEVIRVSSFLEVFRLKQISINQLFPGGLYPKKLGMKLLTLNDKSYCKEHTQYLSKNRRKLVQHEILAAEDIKYDLDGVVVKCADGNPLVDIKSFYATPAGKQIKFVRQMKHGLQADDPAAKDKTIQWVTVTNWYKQAKDALVAWADEFEIIYVFITNKTITGVVSANSKGWPNNLIVVHKPCLSHYFGPTITQIAQLSDDD